MPSVAAISETHSYHLAYKDPKLDTCPVPLNPGVLPGWAKAIWSIQRDGFKITTTMPQNCVVAKVNRKTIYGIVQHVKLCGDFVANHQLICQAD
ncbi:hypothetical protein VP01_905g4 [Puccinia sorghi]|uniref:Uncharacterized protein n=1 Tax=Puccinia sorghi TaxID=27349 RepID=A0A0L6U7P3_9BASI|nr:hypothetical protein VP01_905g4 [Puccinia sorghi]